MVEGKCDLALKALMVCVAYEAVLTLYLIVQVFYCVLLSDLARAVTISNRAGLCRYPFERPVAVSAFELDMLLSDLTGRVERGSLLHPVKEHGRRHESSNNKIEFVIRLHPSS